MRRNKDRNQILREAIVSAIQNRTLRYAIGLESAEKALNILDKIVAQKKSNGGIAARKFRRICRRRCGRAVSRDFAAALRQPRRGSVVVDCRGQESLAIGRDHLQGL